MNQDVAELLSTLRESNLAWMADEIATTINNGKVIQKSYRETGTQGRTKRGTQSVPFTDDEQLEVTLVTIKRYMVDLEESWDTANAEFQLNVKAEGDLPVQVIIIPPEGGRAMEPFGPEGALHRRKLTGLIAQAWPGGTEDFFRRVGPQGT
jgi:hypothetical protein